MRVDDWYQVGDCAYIIRFEDGSKVRVHYGHEGVFPPNILNLVSIAHWVSLHSTKIDCAWMNDIAMANGYDAFYSNV